MATLECSAIAVPFLCQYSLSLCKGNQLFSPTRESCFKLRDFCFSDSWLVVEKQKNYGYLLPNCSTLPPGIDLLHSGMHLHNSSDFYRKFFNNKG